MGQQSANFSRAFEANFPTYNALFPSLGKLFGYKENVDIKNVLYIQGLVDQYNVFGFFVKALVWGYGKVGTLFISIAFLLLVKFKIRAFIKDYNIYDFSIIFLIFQVPFFGVFYYRQGVGGMEVSYIAAILLFSLIKLITLKVKI
ncbi:hypothetical protein MASR2M12_16710 [Bacteroidales bacterium]